MYQDHDELPSGDHDMLADGSTDTPTARPSQFALNLSWLSNVCGKFYLAFHVVDFVLNMSVSICFAMLDVPPSYVIASLIFMGSSTFIYVMCFFAWHKLPSNYEPPSAANNYQGRMVGNQGEAFVRRMLKHWFGEYVASFDDLHAFQDRNEALTRDLLGRCVNLPVQREVISARVACSGAQMMLAKSILPMSLRSCFEAPVMGMIQLICCSTGHLDHAAGSITTLVYFSIFFSLLCTIPVGVLATFSRPMVDLRSLLFVYCFGLYMCGSAAYYCVSVANRANELNANGFTLFVFNVFLPACKIVLDAVLWTITSFVFINPTRRAQIGSAAREAPIILSWFLEGEPTLEWRRWRSWAMKQSDLISRSVFTNANRGKKQRLSAAERADRQTAEIRAAVANSQAALKRLPPSLRPISKDVITGENFSPWSLNATLVGGRWRYLIIGGYIVHIVASVVIYGVLPPRQSLPISGVLAFFTFMPLVGMAALANHVYRVVRFRHALRPIFIHCDYIPFRVVVAVMEQYFVPQAPPPRPGGDLPRTAGDVDDTTPEEPREPADPRFESLDDAGINTTSSANHALDFFDEEEETGSITQKIAVEMQQQQQPRPSAVVVMQPPQPPTAAPDLSPEPQAPAPPRPLWGPGSQQATAQASPQHHHQPINLARSSSLSSTDTSPTRAAEVNQASALPRTESTSSQQNSVTGSRADDLMETPSLLDDKAPRRAPSHIGNNRAW